jgi:tetratricopeptide (TPR) repeat protein
VTDDSAAAARERLARGEVTAALDLLRPAIDAAPQDVTLRLLAGEAALRGERPADAVGHLQAALSLVPDHPDALINLGAALLAVDEAAQAVALLEPRAAVAPTRPLLLNLGRALQDVHRLTAAEAVLRGLLDSDPADVEALTNLGTVLRDQGRLAESIQCFESVIRLAPSLQQPRMNLASAYLMQGDYPRGFRAWEARRFQDPSGLSARAPRWDGQAQANLTLHVIAEQGFGDMLMFARFGAELARRGLTAVLHVHPRLVRLLKRCRLFQDVVPYGRAPLGSNPRWVPLMSLPHVLGLTLDTVGLPDPYLQADAARVERWATWLGPRRHVRVGIAWAGNPQSELDDLRGRSMPLGGFAPLLWRPDIEWVCLQRQHGLEQLAAVPAAQRLRRPPEDFDGGPDGFVDTAALMVSLDLIVTCDTSIAHLAGGLRRPTWVALHHTPDWRWHRDRGDSPWYPTLRLFRQTAPGDWPSVVDQMADRLDRALGRHAEGEFTPDAVLF